MSKHYVNNWLVSFGCFFDCQLVFNMYRHTHKSSTTFPESRNAKSVNVDSSRLQQRGMHGQRSGPTCACCRKRGHLISECWILQKKEQKSPLKTAHLYQLQSFRILGLSAEGVLPLSDETATGDDVLISGVELGFTSVPLHKVFLKSDLISGYVVVGICPNLPVKGVGLLLGNDLAGDKVMVSPCVSSQPNVFNDTEMQDTPGLYPACAVTRAMAKRHLTTSQDNNNAKNIVQSLLSSSPT